LQETTEGAEKYSVFSESFDINLEFTKSGIVKLPAYRAGLPGN
jgi:hypothetical protein